MTCSLVSQTLYRLVPVRTEGSGSPTHTLLVTFGDFPHFPRVLLIGSCFIIIFLFLQFRNLLKHKLNVWHVARWLCNQLLVAVMAVHRLQQSPSSRPGARVRNENLHDAASSLRFILKTEQDESVFEVCVTATHRRFLLLTK